MGPSLCGRAIVLELLELGLVCGGALLFGLNLGRLLDPISTWDFCEARVTKAAWISERLGSSADTGLSVGGVAIVSG